MIKNVSVGAAKKKTMAFNVILVHFSIDFGRTTYDICKFMVVTATRRKNLSISTLGTEKCFDEMLGADFRGLKKSLYGFVSGSGMFLGEKSLLQVFPLRKFFTNVCFEWNFDGFDGMKIGKTKKIGISKGFCVEKCLKLHVFLSEICGGKIRTMTLEVVNDETKRSILMCFFRISIPSAKRIAD